MTRSHSVRCVQCGHQEGVHRPKERGIPAHCKSCTGRRALHSMARAPERMVTA